MLDVCHVQTLTRIWHSFDSNGLFSGGFACRTWQWKCMTVHQNKLVSFIVKRDLIFCSRPDENQTLLQILGFFFFSPLPPLCLYSEGWYHLQLFTISSTVSHSGVKFYSAPLKPAFSTGPNIKVPLQSIGTQGNSNLHSLQWSFH